MRSHLYHRSRNRPITYTNCLRQRTTHMALTRCPRRGTSAKHMLVQVPMMVGLGASVGMHSCRLGLACCLSQESCCAHALLQADRHPLSLRSACGSAGGVPPTLLGCSRHHRNGRLCWMVCWSPWRVRAMKIPTNARSDNTY